MHMTAYVSFNCLAH